MLLSRDRNSLTSWKLKRKKIRANHRHSLLHVFLLLTISRSVFYHWHKSCFDNRRFFRFLYYIFLFLIRDLYFFYFFFKFSIKFAKITFHIMKRKLGWNRNGRIQTCMNPCNKVDKPVGVVCRHAWITILFYIFPRKSHILLWRGNSNIFLKDG